MTQLKDLSGVHTIRLPLPVAFATAGTEDTVPAFVAPFNLTVEEVRFVPSADVTGNDGNETVLALQNRGADGDGTTAIATLTFDTGTDAADFVDQPFDLSGTLANLDVDEGHVVAIDKSITSSGLAIEGSIEVDVINRGV